MLAADPKIKVVGRFLGGLATNAVTSVETALQKFPHIQGVVGINDAGDLGAYKALEERRSQDRRRTPSSSASTATPRRSP